MKRELKFRVFIKEKKRIVYIGVKHNDTHVIFMENGTWFVYDTFTGEYELIASSENEDIIMQYTNFKDKNDNEIYEGDIITFNHNYNYSILFIDGSFICFHTNLKELDESPLRWGLLSRAFELSDVKCNIEIIGNIYENFKEDKK